MPNNTKLEKTSNISKLLETLRSTNTPTPEQKAAQLKNFHDWEKRMAEDRARRDIVQTQDDAADAASYLEALAILGKNPDA